LEKKVFFMCNNASLRGERKKGGERTWPSAQEGTENEILNKRRERKNSSL